MSVSEHFRHLQHSSIEWLNYLVETPIQDVFGRRHAASTRQPGADPGTLFVDPRAAPTSVRLWHIHQQQVECVEQPDAEEIRRRHQAPGRIWLDVAGLADDQRLRELGEIFGIHPLTLADLVNVERHTRVDSLDDQALILLQVLHPPESNQRPALGQMGVLLGDQVLLSFRERPSGLFQPIENRLARNTSRLRSEPLDYLASALLDVAVDASFPVVEALADRLDALEDLVMQGQGYSVLADLHQQRRGLITLGRLFWRQRDLLARLLRDDDIFRRPTHIYLRDVYDRTVQLLDMVETTRDLAASLVEIHLSISSNRANQIMQTLTIMASIFIPLTFIAGVYGMNFEHMPELTWAWGYPAVLGLMLSVSLGLLLWFRARGWLGRR